MVLGSGIRDPGSEIRDPEKTYSGSWIPDPGSRGQKAPDPGSRIRIRNTDYQIENQSIFTMFFIDLKQLGRRSNIHCTSLSAVCLQLRLTPPPGHSRQLLQSCLTSSLPKNIMRQSFGTYSNVCQHYRSKLKNRLLLLFFTAGDYTAQSTYI